MIYYGYLKQNRQDFNQSDSITILKELYARAKGNKNDHLTS